MHPRIKPNDARPFYMAITYPFGLIWNLAGVMTGVVGKWSFWPAFVVHLRLPLHVCCRVKLGDLKSRALISPKPTNSSVHDITRNPLNSVNEIDVLLPIQGTVIYLAVADIGIVKPLLD